MTESVVLCEGYHDRAFWAGFLRHLGCDDPGVKQGIPERVPVKDIRGEAVTQGQFYFYTHTGNGIRVVPCHGKEKVLRTLRRFIDQRNTRPFVQLVVNVDSDVKAAAPNNNVTGLRNQDILREAQAYDSTAQAESSGEISLDQGGTKLALIRWEVADAVTPGLPDQQTLERLVCAAIVAAYPPRGQCVQNWLDARHAPPPIGVKEFAWSHMAGWYPEHGCDDFYRCLWDDMAIVAELKTRLEVSGAWQIAEALAI